MTELKLQKTTIKATTVARELGKTLRMPRYQRSYVWGNTEKNNKKSALIFTLMRGWGAIVPPVYSNRYVDEDGKKIAEDIIDGQQRMTTVADFINGKFKLIGLPQIPANQMLEIAGDDISDEEKESNQPWDLNGYTFDMLMPSLQKRITDFSFEIRYVENADEETARALFVALNNGKTLTATELNLAKAQDFDAIQKLALHPVFEGMLSSAGFKNYSNKDIVVKTYLMLDVYDRESGEIDLEKVPSLDSKDVTPVLQDATIEKSEQDQITNIFDYLKAVREAITDDYKKARKMIGQKTHLMSLIPVIEKCIAEKVEPIILARFVQDFYDKAKLDDIGYTEYASSGSNHKVSVQYRVQIVAEAFDEFYADYDESAYIEETDDDVDVEDATEDDIADALTEGVA